MTKCPYVPPHPWNVDFPHLMLRAKAHQVQATARSRSARSCSPRTDAHRQARRHPGRRAGGQRGEPHAGRAQADGQACSASHRDAWLPPLRDAALSRRRAQVARRAPVDDGERTPGKVAIFSTCYVNYNEPGIGHDLVEAARAQRDPVRARREGELLRHAQARARRPRRRREAQGGQHPGARALRARGLRDPDAGAVVHADVQAGAAADVPRRRRRASACRRRCSIRSSTSSRATATAC